MYGSSVEMIDSIIMDLNRLEVKGVTNMGIVITSVQKLGSLKRGLELEKEERRKEHERNNEQRANV